MRSPTNLPDPIAHQAIQHVWISITAMMMALACFSLPTSARADTSWDGTWFTCEFAQRQRAPDDGCAMFDDEGFRFSDGRLTYVRITASDETACRGEARRLDNAFAGTAHRSALPPQTAASWIFWKTAFMCAIFSANRFSIFEIRPIIAKSGRMMTDASGPQNGGSISPDIMARSQKRHLQVNPPEPVSLVIPNTRVTQGLQAI